MKEKIAGILGCTYVKMTGSCSDCEYNKTNFCQRWSTIDALEALIEQEQKAMRRALGLAKIQIEFAQSIHWLNSGEEILVKIDAVLG